MSRFFMVAEPQNHEEPTIAEVLTLLSDLRLFGLAKKTKAEEEAFLAQPLSAVNQVIVGVEGISHRGLEVSFNKETRFWVVRAYAPSSPNDWAVCVAVLRALVRRTGNPIYTDRGDEAYTDDTIAAYPWEAAIEEGLTMVKERLANNPNTRLYLSGVQRDISVSLAWFEAIMEQPNPVKAFGLACEQAQYPDGIVAEQNFYYQANPNEVIGLYAVGLGLPMVLPYQLFVEVKNQSALHDKTITGWFLRVAVNDGGTWTPCLEVPYVTFLTWLPKEKRTYIDATHMRVEPLTADDVKSLQAFAYPEGAQA